MKSVVLLSGPAGSGLSSAEFVFEELGYYVVKNAPARSISAVLDAVFNSKVEKVCLLVHARRAKEVLNILKQSNNFDFRFVMLNASTEVLLKRFALTRRVHPRSVTDKLSPENAIRKDVDDILQLIPEAHCYIDTTALTVKQLRGKLFNFLENMNDGQQL